MPLVYASAVLQETRIVIDLGHLYIDLGIAMSGKATETGEAETAFVHSSPSRGYSQASTGLYVQDESVSFPPSTRTGGAREDAPLLSSRSRVS